MNSQSIGIELANPGDAPFPEPQMAALERLLAVIMARWAIHREGVIGHSDMAPERKRDPGPRFDWQRLARSGLAIWPRAEGDPSADFGISARTFGYPDVAPDAVLAAFRLRFRPGVHGPEDDTDRAMVDDLARRFPFNRLT